MLKHIYCLFFLLLSASTTYSQIDLKNLTAIPIEDFENTLLQLNFEISELHPENQYSIFNGKYEEEDCDILVSYSKYRILESFLITFKKNYINWSSAKKDIEKWQEHLSRELGEPTPYISFEEPYKEGDGKEIEAIRYDNATYEYYWYLENGTVELSFNSLDGVFISISYTINGMEE